MKKRNFKFLRKGNHPPLIFLLVGIICIFAIVYIIRFSHVDIESGEFWEGPTIYIVTALCLVGLVPVFYFFIKELVEYNIDPETEFWGHCSNLQTWYENDYDTQLLHSNLAFPLLKHLTDCGDPSAKKVFKEEIAKRIESGYLPVVLYLIEEKYLRYLSSEELNVVLTGPTFSKFLTMPAACAWKTVYMFHDLLDAIKGTDMLKENFLELLTVVENMSDVHDQYDAFRDLLVAIEGTEVLKKYFLELLTAVRKMRDNDYKRDAFNDLLEVIK